MSLLGAVVVAQLVASAPSPPSELSAEEPGVATPRSSARRHLILPFAIGAGGTFAIAAATGWRAVRATTRAERARMHCDSIADPELAWCSGVLFDKRDPKTGRTLWGTIHGVTTATSATLAAIAAAEGARLRWDRGGRSLHPAAGFTLGIASVGAGIAGIAVGYLLGFEDCELWTQVPDFAIEGEVETRRCQERRDRRAIPTMLAGTLGVVVGSTLIGDATGTQLARRRVQVSVGSDLDGATLSVTGRF